MWLKIKIYWKLKPSNLSIMVKTATIKFTFFFVNIALLIFIQKCKFHVKVIRMLRIKFYKLIKSSNFIHIIKNFYSFFNFRLILVSMFWFYLFLFFILIRFIGMIFFSRHYDLIIRCLSIYLTISYHIPCPCRVKSIQNSPYWLGQKSKIP